MGRSGDVINGQIVLFKFTEDLVGSVVHEYTHFELFINFPAICLDFVVLARITQTNNSKTYLKAQLLIDLTRS